MKLNAGDHLIERGQINYYYSKNAMKQWVILILFLFSNFFPISIFGSEIFQKLSHEFSEQTIKEFIHLVTKKERYPLLHIVTQLRFNVFKTYLNINNRLQTLDCLKHRNFGIKIPPNKIKFCTKYNELVDGSKVGLENLDVFEKIYFKVEPLLLREIETRQAREPMRKWIQQKLRCLDPEDSSHSRCGKNEREMIARVTSWEGNIIRMYRHVLGNLEKKLYPEQGNLNLIDEEDLDSPCIITQNVNGMFIHQGMVSIPQGTYIMGNDKGRPNEKRAHAVSLDSFWIDRCEVSNFDYLKLLVRDNYLRKSTFPRQFHDRDYLDNWIGDLKPPPNRDNYPVAYVSWYAARYYCQSLGKRLPSEAEWEKASRAGQFADYPFDPSAKLSDYGWYNENSENHLRLIASREPNQFQLYDMLGNVWEWVYDWYAPYPSSRADNPQGPPSGQYRIYRGGSWQSPADHLRVSFRGDDSPINTSSDVGFRCAATDHPGVGN